VQTFQLKESYGVYIYIGSDGGCGEAMEALVW
jgi:hypothetical protein